MVASSRGAECKDLELSLGMPGMADTATGRRVGAWRCLRSVILMHHSIVPPTSVLLFITTVSLQAGSVEIWKRLGASLFSVLNYTNDW